MRKIFLTILGTIVISNFLFAQSGWQTITLPTGVNLTTKIKFVNPSTGYILANSIYKTTDGGNTWSQKTSALNPNAFQNIVFADANTGYYLQSGGLIYKTTNAGENWLQIQSNVSSYDVNFLNSNTGWLMHDNYVSKTTDGGMNFTHVLVNDTMPSILCGYFLNANTGWVSGFRSVYKTTNGGLNWEIKGWFTSVINKMAYSIKFINEQTGFVSGAGGIVGKTTNSGVTWNISYLGTSLLRDINFINNQTGWISGSRGSLYKTTNTGETWSDCSSDTLFYFIDIEFINQNTGWITTNTNKLLKTTDGGNVFVMQTSTNIPENFKLGQNYPNPFNPSTIINYSLKRSEIISLKVFYSDGRVAENLVNEIQSPGEYQIIFNATHLPSGVYYYKMTTENFSETKKMILIK